MCDCVPLLCCPECQVLEENKVGSSLTPYSLSNSLSSQCFAGICRVQALQHQETPEMKHIILRRCSSWVMQKTSVKNLHFCNQPAIQKLTDCGILDWREWFCVFVNTCELPRRDSELQKCYRMWSYICKMLFNILTSILFYLEQVLNSLELRNGKWISCDFLENVI